MRVLPSLLLVSASQAHDVCLRWNASTMLACNVSTPCAFLTRNTSSCFLSVDLNETVAANSSWLGDRPFLAQLFPQYDSEDDDDDDEDEDGDFDDRPWRSPPVNRNETLPWTLWLSWGGNVSAYFDLEHLFNWTVNSSSSTDNTIVFPPHGHATKKPYVLRRWNASTNASATPYPTIVVPRNDSAYGRRTTPPRLALNGTVFNEAYLVSFLQYLFNATRHRNDLMAFLLHRVINLLQTNGSVAAEAIQRFRVHPPSNDMRLWSLLFTANSTQHRNVTGHPVDAMRPLGEIVWQVYLESLGGWNQSIPRLPRPMNCTLQRGNETTPNETAVTIAWPPASNRSSDRPTMLPFRPLRPTPRPSRNDSGSGSDANASMTTPTITDNGNGSNTNGSATTPTITVSPSDALAATSPTVTTSSSHVDVIVLLCVAVVAVGFLAARVYARRHNIEAYSHLQD
ncbi:hypothetical protein SDRG_11698 [Saprolegnia diclina VS20]|uniref:Uncharacterized protein n=1 Tax=Saprolegnia diclina (strain VS20) TaxID=1156394 RepID=T0REC4_SAPDV|nr:hypothetical protein SDRG_11698 [Saprolegnia diclina VS20]EQC30643.1 hypothetical protein SDRG_11698 [Saprolegnia diclina VS20]|eukprot:XP_008615969.1 hypothetical protein SDRG_11698 [Saprolegnia diclina VS20]